jgi:hypothetical protein
MPAPTMTVSKLLPDGRLRQVTSALRDRSQTGVPVRRSRFVVTVVFAMGIDATRRLPVRLPNMPQPDNRVSSLIRDGRQSDR